VSLIRELFSRLFAPFRKADLDHELDEDLHEHLEMLVGEYRERGMNEQEAGRAAQIRLGGIEQIGEMHREQRGFQSLETLVARRPTARQAAHSRLCVGGCSDKGASHSNEHRHFLGSECIGIPSSRCARGLATRQYLPDLPRKEDSSHQRFDTHVFVC
jgi:hypothetical protein